MLTTERSTGILRANVCTKGKGEMFVRLQKKDSRKTGAKTLSDVLLAAEQKTENVTDSVDVKFKKSEGERQIVYGEVYAPMVPDAHGDYMKPETIMDAAYEFMKELRLTKIDVEHDEIESGAYVVESFIAREGDPDFIEGSWVIGVHVPDEGMWSKVKKGELNGFSLSGLGYKTKKSVSLEMEESLTGLTTEVEGHTHEFIVKYDETGKFLGGTTSPGPDGHVHEIYSGTVTSMTNGHRHRFSFVEGVLCLEADD